MSKVIYSKIVGDLFHVGHLKFLIEAKALGDKLIVQVVADERVAKYKRKPYINQADRAAIISACKYVDEVKLEGPKEITLDFMNQNKYDIYAYGFSSPKEALVKRQDCSELPDERIAIIAYTKGISTTAIIEKIVENSTI